MSDRTTALLGACAAGDDVAIRLAGWWPVLDALRWWPRPVNGEVLAPYASALGDQDPEAIVGALRAELAGGHKWRPSPSEILQRLRPADSGGPGRVHPGRGQGPPRPDRLAQTSARVLRAAAEGSEVCDCLPRPAEQTIDADGVLRCPGCAGLDLGQYEHAIDQEEPS